jgi:CHASE3 domain sensor protein
MQVYWKRFSVMTGFGILMAMLITGTVVTRRRLAVQIADHQWVTHTRQVLFELERAESLLKDAETGQRGYLYTADAKYLAPYNQARNQIDPNIDTLAQLVADNPSQQDSISDLRNLSHEKLAELKQTIELFQAGSRDDARAIVLSNRGLALMSHIREIIDTMKSRELALESERTSRYEQNVYATIWWIYFFSGVAIAGLAMLAYLILREMQLREKHNEEVREREEWLRTTLTSIGDAVIATDGKGWVTFLNPLGDRINAGCRPVNPRSVPDFQRVYRFGE